MNKEKNSLELMGDRLLEVCRDHHKDKKPTIELISDVLWALDLRISVSVVIPETLPASNEEKNHE